MTQMVVGQHKGKVEGRVPVGRPIGTPDEIYEYTCDQLQQRPWTQQMIHQPAGWKVRYFDKYDKPAVWATPSDNWTDSRGVEVLADDLRRGGSMTGAQWASMTDEMQQAYTAALAESLAKRHDLKPPWIYGGLQWYTPFSNQGDERKQGVRFDQEPWAIPHNITHIEGLVELTIKPWVLCGAGGWVFDLGSKHPGSVLTWRQRMQPEVGLMVVGLEALPYERGKIDWHWATDYGIHYHALAQFKNGTPFDETVPDGVTAFVWLRNKRHPTVEWVQGCWDRGWSLCVDDDMDQFVLDAIDGAEAWT